MSASLRKELTWTADRLVWAISVLKEQRTSCFNRKGQ